MTDVEKRNELAAQIKELRAQLKPLEEKFRKLNSKIKADHKTSLPYRFNGGYYNQTKSGVTAVYWNYGERTYYQIPLYKPSHIPYGMRTRNKDIEEMVAELKAKGFVECF